jgi:hypothetical protein
VLLWRKVQPVNGLNTGVVGEARGLVADNFAQPRQRLVRGAIRAGAGGGNQQHQPVTHDQSIRPDRRNIQAG